MNNNDNNFTYKFLICYLAAIHYAVTLGDESLIFTFF
jgi:hypothetical protein